MCQCHNPMGQSGFSVCFFKCRWTPVAGHAPFLSEPLTPLCRHLCVFTLWYLNITFTSPKPVYNEKVNVTENLLFHWTVFNRLKMTRTKGNERNHFVIWVKHEVLPQTLGPALWSRPLVQFGSCIYLTVTHPLCGNGKWNVLVELEVGVVMKWAWWWEGPDLRRPSFYSHSTWLEPCQPSDKCNRSIFSLYLYYLI